MQAEPQVHLMHAPYRYRNQVKGPSLTGGAHEEVGVSGDVVPVALLRLELDILPSLSRQVRPRSGQP